MCEKGSQVGNRIVPEPREDQQQLKGLDVGGGKEIKGVDGNQIAS